jgi:hypothetical protein
MSFAAPTNLVPAQESAPAPEVASFNVKAGLAQMLKVLFAYSLPRSNNNEQPKARLATDNGRHAQGEEGDKGNKQAEPKLIRSH